VTAGELDSQKGRPASAQEERTENGSEWPGLDRSARRGGDCFGGRIRLLCGQAALLDREGGEIAGCVDVRSSGDTTVPVCPDEAIPIARNPVDLGPA
jgi:hypothetical protein